MKALPSLRQLRYLVTVAETLNFTQAAQACFVTQSTLSGGIQELERLLDARLLERDRQHVRLTPVGATVVARARELLSMAEDLVEQAAHAAQPMSGQVRLGAIPTIAPFLLPGVLRESRLRYPALKIVLREDQTVRLVNQLREGSLDFALLALPWELDGLLCQPLFHEELWLIAAPGDPVARQARPAVDALDADRMLLLEEGHCLRQHTLAGCGLAERANTGGIEATSLTTLVQMVEEGLGYGLLPEMAIRAGLLKGSNLVARPIADPAPRRQIALVARNSTARRAEFDALAQITAGLARTTPSPRRTRRAS
jgi:LysR family hydrogen peroxide-inducible transcriptional activator